MIEYGMGIQESGNSAVNKEYIITYWIPSNKSTGGGYYLQIKPIPPSEDER